MHFAMSNWRQSMSPNMLSRVWSKYAKLSVWKKLSYRTRGRKLIHYFCNFYDDSGSGCPCSAYQCPVTTTATTAITTTTAGSTSNLPIWKKFKISTSSKIFLEFSVIMILNSYDKSLTVITPNKLPLNKLLSNLFHPIWKNAKIEKYYIYVVKK